MSTTIQYSDIASRRLITLRDGQITTAGRPGVNATTVMLLTERGSGERRVFYGLPGADVASRFGVTLGPRQ